MTRMLISKKTSLIISGLTALVSSRAFFALLNDPEGPNLLIVTVLAGVLYVLSWWAVRLMIPAAAGLKRLFLVVLIQIVIVAVLYFFLH